jgi:triacylglycerol lipase
MAEFHFDTNQTRWSDRNAFACALAAQLAYADAQTIDSTVKQWGFRRSIFLDRFGTQGFLAGGDEMILLAFRGTEPAMLKDWMADMDVEPVGFLGGEVHLGFLRALRAVWSDVTAGIAALQTGAQSLWLTGHSLGAALATLAAARLRIEAGTPLNGLYTFGSPRVGNGDFTSRFDQVLKVQTFRYVNNADVVTRVPNRVPFGYRHVGTFLYFDEHGDIETDEHWWNRFLNAVQGDAMELLSGKIAPLDDHFIANYIANTQRNLGKNPF